MDQQIVSFESQKKWEEWLSQNHSSSDGIWIRFFKKDSGLQTFNYAQALDEALCYGWIDGQARKLNEKSYLQKFTPRRKRSMWSQRNTGHIARLTKLGKMKPSGIAEVERAKEDGRWDNAYASSSNMVAPDDFLKSISKNKKAKDFWEVLNKTNRFAMIFQINSAKKEETRIRRIEKFVKMLAEGKKLY